MDNNQPQAQIWNELDLILHNTEPNDIAKWCTPDSEHIDNYMLADWLRSQANTSIDVNWLADQKRLLLYCRALEDALRRSNRLTGEKRPRNELWGRQLYQQLTKADLLHLARAYVTNGQLKNNNSPLYDLLDENDRKMLSLMFARCNGARIYVAHDRKRYQSLGELMVANYLNRLGEPYHYSIDAPYRGKRRLRQIDFWLPGPVCYLEVLQNETDSIRKTKRHLIYAKNLVTKRKQAAELVHSTVYLNTENCRPEKLYLRIVALMTNLLDEHQPPPLWQTLECHNPDLRHWLSLKPQQLVKEILTEVSGLTELRNHRSYLYRYLQQRKDFELCHQLLRQAAKRTGSKKRSCTIMARKFQCQWPWKRQHNWLLRQNLCQVLTLDDCPADLSHSLGVFQTWCFNYDKYRTWFERCGIAPRPETVSNRPNKDWPALGGEWYGWSWALGYSHGHRFVRHSMTLAEITAMVQPLQLWRLAKIWKVRSLRTIYLSYVTQSRVLPPDLGLTPPAPELLQTIEQQPGFIDFYTLMVADTDQDTFPRPELWDFETAHTYVLKQPLTEKHQRSVPWNKVWQHFADGDYKDCLWDDRLCRSPDCVFRDKGWLSWSHWISGIDTSASMRIKATSKASFKTQRQWARGQKLWRLGNQRARIWEEYVRNFSEKHRALGMQPLPKNHYRTPQQHLEGWRGWRDFIGSADEEP